MIYNQWYLPYWGNLPLDKKFFKKRNLAKYKNNMEFANLFSKYYALTTNMIKFNNLPEGCDERFILRSWILTGNILFCRDKVSPDKILSLACSTTSGINVYGYPTKAVGYGLNGLVGEYDVYVPGAETVPVLRRNTSGSMDIDWKQPDGVIVYGSIDGYPPVAHLITACERLADIIRACDVVVQNMKSPYVITCAETEYNTVNQAMELRDENQTTIITAKGFNLENIQVLPMATPPETLPTLWAQYRNIESRYLEQIGLNSNDNTDKKERLLVDEVNANNQLTSLSRNCLISWLQKGLDDVNKVFGTNITVEINPEVLQEMVVEDDVDTTKDFGRDTPNNDD